MSKIGDLKVEIATLKQKISNADSSISRLNAQKPSIDACSKIPKWDYRYREQGCSGLPSKLSAINSIRSLNTSKQKLVSQLQALEIKLLAEEVIHENYLREQEILQQTFITDTGEQTASQSVEISKQEAEKAKQEQAKANQELMKLRVESARAEVASRLADKGNTEGAKVLLGVEGSEESWKKPVMMGGILLASLGIGFGIYKMIK